VLIVGSLNAKKEDRTLQRSETVPLQLMLPDGTVHPVPAFRELGELGISSIAWEKENPTKWYLSTGSDLLCIDIERNTREELPVDNLAGVHEIAFIDSILWIANTRFDEVVGFDPKKNKVVDRIMLSDFRGNKNGAGNGYAKSDAHVVDKFHCNQVFESYQGNLLALSHHVTGQQLMQKIADKLLKKQGNGGIINIQSGEFRDLGLNAPHSVRKVDNRYWVFDSGAGTLNVYNKQWELIHRSAYIGWGRGGDLAQGRKSFYVGISAPRKRYLGVIKGPRQGVNKLLQMNVGNFKITREVELESIEQINNLYTISEEVASLLLKDSAKAHA